MNLLIGAIAILLFSTAALRLSDALVSAGFLTLPPWLSLLLGALLGGLCLLQLMRKDAQSGYAFVYRVALLVLVVVAALQTAFIWTRLDAELIFDLRGQTSLLLHALGIFLFALLLRGYMVHKFTAGWVADLEEVFSGPPFVLAATAASILSGFLLMGMFYLQLNHADFIFLTQRFLLRGIIPPLCLFLFCLGALLCAGKYIALKREVARFIAHERQAKVLPYTLRSWQGFRAEKGANIDYFLEVIGQKSEGFYAFPRYINWSVPILGFIGTVLGISLASEGIGSIISSDAGLAKLSADLGDAIAPLGIAFDTTLIALSLSIVLVFLQAALQVWEDKVLLDFEGRLAEQKITGI